MNKPCSKELAILLKEKGFDEISNYNYSEVYGYIENINNLRHSDGNNRFVSAPTIADIIMWLYEKQNIWIYSEIISGDEFRFCVRNIYQLHLGQYNELYVNDLQFSSPAEAYEAAIKYCLNKLI